MQYNTFLKLTTDGGLNYTLESLQMHAVYVCTQCIKCMFILPSKLICCP